MKKPTYRLVCTLASACLTAGLLASLPKSSFAGDWPQWRYDAGRGAASPDELPNELRLQWTRQLPLPRPAWPASQPWLRFDVSYSPVAAGKLLYVPSMVTDTVTAYDTETGTEKWRLYTGGPVRFAPIVHRGKVYFGSDDGYLYCVDAAGGTLVWKFRGGPSDRKILGNERLISTWPVRGGPVLFDGTVYFTAGIWPFMGIFVHAVDAQTGKTIWTNSGDSITYQTNPHNSPAFAGLVPRGHLAVTDKGLVAPGGRTPPGTYDLKTGRLVHFAFAKSGGRSSHQIVPIKAGSRTFTAAEGVVTAGNWKGTIEGTPWNMLAADGKLFVVTTAGRIYCFGAKEGEPTTYEAPAPPEPAASEENAAANWKPHAERVLKATKVADGYAVMLGLGTGGLAEALLRASNVHLIVIDPDARRINAFRRRIQDAGLYGVRVSAHVGDPVTYPLPPYLASLIVSEDLDAAGMGRGAPFIKNLFRALRPYGGVACLQVDAKKLEGPVQLAQLANAGLKSAGNDWSLLVREGALPGAADWTHNYADAAGSVVSKDKLARAPLGILWFGNGPPNDEVLPRHGHGPAPQVAAGRLFIEGRHMLRALDVYTGRLLWQKQLPDLGRFHDNTRHQPGAGEIGSNYVSLEDSVYVVYGERILRVDAATGETIKEFSLPAASAQKAPNWGYVGCWKDLLVAGAAPVGVSKSGFVPNVQYASASKRLVVMDRRTGKPLWTRTAKYSFRHNNIALGAEKVFCIDGLSRAKLAALKRRGISQADYKPQLLALDVRTGKEIWSAGKDVFGTFLNYSAEHDVLLQAGSRYRDRAGDESGTGMVAYRGKDGSLIWKDLARNHAGPCMLHHGTIITQGPAYSLLTGRPKIRKNPLTGQPMQWKFTRNYGCNTAVASEHLITFRSAAAGFYDLAGDGGTGNFGGFKSGCTSNLIAAGGLLNAPEYTRTCSCNYQNQTSLALVHDPDVEMWTFNAFAWDGKPVRRVGINFGAPGDRPADGGTLWLDYPTRGGPSPDIPVELQADRADYFRYHSSHVRADPDGRELNWVAASGTCGLQAVTLTLAKDEQQTRKYTVRLHFAEVEGLEPGRRVFNVSLQGKQVLKDFDIVKQAGGRNRAVVKEFTGVEVAGKLKVSLVARGKQGSPPPVLCGIEVLAEGW